MSLVVGDTDLGNPLDAASALADVARNGGGGYASLLGVLEADGEDVGVEYTSAVRSEARRALADQGHRFRATTRDFLDRVTRIRP